jgi:hypothetical protein
MRADLKGRGFKVVLPKQSMARTRRRMMLKFAILGAALSFLGTFELAQEAPPVHQGDWPIHNSHKYQPTQDDLEKLDTQDITRKEAKEVDRLYNQLESTGGEPQSGDEVNEGGLDKFIEEENQRLDRVDNICRGC